MILTTPRGVWFLNLKCSKFQIYLCMLTLFGTKCYVKFNVSHHRYTEKERERESLVKHEILWHTCQASMFLKRLIPTPSLFRRCEKVKNKKTGKYLSCDRSFMSLPSLGCCSVQFNWVKDKFLLPKKFLFFSYLFIYFGLNIPQPLFTQLGLSLIKWKEMLR